MLSNKATTRLQLDWLATSQTRWKALSRPWHPRSSHLRVRIKTRLSVSIFSLSQINYLFQADDPIIIRSLCRSFFDNDDVPSGIKSKIKSWPIIILPLCCNNCIATSRVKNSQQNKKIIRNLPQIPSLKMAHISPTNAGNTSMVTPTAGNVRGGIQSLTIETGSQKQHPSQILTTGATSPANAANNP